MRADDGDLPFLLPDGPCVTDRPRSYNHITFGGKYIDMGALLILTPYTYSSLIKIFSGTRTPSMRGAMALAHALGITTDDLYRGLARSGTPRTMQKRLGKHDISLT